MALATFLKNAASGLGHSVRRVFKRGAPRAAGDRGILAFANTSEVIAAERLLREEGLEVSVMGPPPDLQTGCDMVLVFPLLKQAEVERILKNAAIDPEKVIAQADLFLEPVSLFDVTDLGEWLMVRAANVKITIEKKSGLIVNISGGGCPDVPWLAREMTGKALMDAPEPLSMGHTLCSYCLQKAYEELKRIQPCG